MSYALVNSPAQHSAHGSRRAAVVAPSRDAMPCSQQETAAGIAVRFNDNDNRADAVITIAGDLDLANVLEFRDAAFSALGEKPALLLLDLTGVTFLDTAGLSALLTVVRVARMVGARARVIPSDRVRRTLSLSGLADALEA